MKDNENKYLSLEDELEYFINSIKEAGGYLDENYYENKEEYINDNIKSNIKNFTFKIYGHFKAKIEYQNNYYENLLFIDSYFKDLY